jgi:steroid delta-isomerase-like uncharacterized protein
MSDSTGSLPITIDTLVSAWNSHDPARLVACYAPDATYEEVPLGTPLHGQAALQTMFAALFQAFPDLVMTVGQRAEEGECLAWEWIITGTQQGEFNEIPATGNAVKLRGVTWCCVRGGKVAEDREYWDLNSLLKQLEANP